MQAQVVKTWLGGLPWGRIAQVVIIGSLAVVFVVTIRDLRGYDFTLLPGRYAAGLALALGAVLSIFYTWFRLIARVSGRSVPLGQAVSVFAASWLGRYVPGRVWSSVGKVYVGSKLGLSTEELTLASVLEQVFSTLAHIVIALFFLFFMFSRTVYSPGTIASVAILLLGAGLIVVQAPILRRIVNMILTRLGCRSLEHAQFPDNTESVVFVLAYFVPLLLSGGSFWMILLALDSTATVSLPSAVGIFVMGSFIGKVTLVLPAGGIGVREAALVFLLQPMVGLSLAILASLISTAVPRPG